MKTLSDADKSFCLLVGIQPPRPITPADLRKFYPGMPLVQAGIWQNLENSRKGATP